MILEKRLHLVDSVQSFSLALDITRLILIVVSALADEQLLLEALLEEVLLVRVLRVGSVSAGRLSSLSRLRNLSLRIGFSACLVHFLHFS